MRHELPEGDTTPDPLVRRVHHQEERMTDHTPPGPYVFQPFGSSHTWRGPHLYGITGFRDRDTTIRGLTRGEAHGVLELLTNGPAAKIKPTELFELMPEQLRDAVWYKYPQEWQELLDKLNARLVAHPFAPGPDHLSSDRCLHCGALKEDHDA